MATAPVFGSSSVKAVLPHSLLTAISATGSWLQRNAIAILVVAVSTGIYTLYSLHVHLAFQSNSFDLGIFAQGVKGYAEGIGPISPIKGPGYSLLGDHFSPITALLGPVYLLFPSIIVLLVAQAFLFGLGAAPLVAWSKRSLGSWQAVTVGFVYASSFGLASAIAFDFHEVAFAVPLLSFSLCALGQGRYASTAAWAAPLVLVKEDLGITVAAVGGVLLLRGQRRLGVGLLFGGVAATLLETFLLIPLANTSGAYDYSGQMSAGALSTLLHPAPDVLSTKITSLIMTLMIGLFLGTRSTMILIAVPTFLWRFAGSNPGYWGTLNQYSAVLMPIVVAAVVEVLVRSDQQSRGSHSFVRWALIASACVSLLVACTFPLSQMARSTFWHVDPRLATLQQAVSEVPTGTTVAASNKLVPQLTDRATVSVLSDLTVERDRPTWIVADLREAAPDTPQQREATVEGALDSGYREVFDRDDVVVLRR